jgi:hypothetical protein
MDRAYWSVILGLAISVVGGHVLTLLAAKAWEESNTWLAQPLGVVERAAYTVSLLYGEPTFIGVWLAIKTLGVAAWSTDQAGKQNRMLYQRSLILNAVSLGWGVLGWRVIVWGQSGHHYGEAVGVVLAAAVASGGLAAWIRWHRTLLQDQYKGAKGPADEATSEEG